MAPSVDIQLPRDPGIDALYAGWAASDLGRVSIEPSTNTPIEPSTNTPIEPSTNTPIDPVTPPPNAPALDAGGAADVEPWRVDLSHTDYGTLNGMFTAMAPVSGAPANSDVWVQFSTRIDPLTGKTSAYDVQVSPNKAEGYKQLRTDGQGRVDLAQLASPETLRNLAAFSQEKTGTPGFSLSYAGIAPRPGKESADPAALDTYHEVRTDAIGNQYIDIPKGKVKESGYYLSKYDPNAKTRSFSQVEAGTPGATYINAELGTMSLGKPAEKLPEPPKKEWYESPMGMLGVASALSVIGVIGQYFIAKEGSDTQMKIARENRDTQLELLGMQLAARGSGDGSSSSGSLRAGRVF